MARSKLIDMIISYTLALIPALFMFLTSKFLRDYTLVFGIDILVMILLPLIMREFSNYSDYRGDIYFYKYHYQCSDREIPYVILTVILSLVAFLFLNNDVFSKWSSLVLFMPTMKGIMKIIYLVILFFLYVLVEAVVEERFYNSQINGFSSNSELHPIFSAIVITVKWAFLIFYSIKDQGTFWLVVAIFAIVNLMICYVSVNEFYRYGVLMRETFYFMIFAYFVFLNLAKDSRGAPSSVYGSSKNVFNRMN